MSRLLYFVSSHGFGHAARAAAVMDAVRETVPGSRFTVFTTVPAWFFEDSLGGPVEIEPVTPDIGLVQKDSLTEDLDATIAKLRATIPFRDAETGALARRIEAASPDLVLCDISPLGLAAARRAGVPTLLVENFTWDFIYRGYGEEHPEILEIADVLAEVFAGATYRVQTEPFCVAVPGTLRTAPVARRPRLGRQETRRLLGVPEEAPLAMITMGGIEWSYERLAAETGAPGDPWLVIPGGVDRERRDGRVIRLPHRSRFYHPDLVEAADVVVGKLGYSTLAEVSRAGAPLGYLRRPRFPESAPLEAWVEERLSCRRLEAAQLEDGRWLDAVRELLEAPRRPQPANGAAEVARFVASILSS